MAARPQVPDGQDQASALLERLASGIDRLESRFDRLDDQIRGRDGDDGLVGRIGHLERTEKELRELFNQLRDSMALKVFHEPEPTPATMKAKAEAVAIRVGAFLAIFWAVIEAWERLNLGGLP